MQITTNLKRRLYQILSFLLILILLPLNVIGAASAEEEPAEMAITSGTEILAQWNFTSSGTGGIIPASSGVNQLSSTIQAVGGPFFEALVSTDNSIKYQGWDNGANTKYWLATLSTKDYENITLSSQQTSTGSGPRDFKVQISGDNQTWSDVPNGGLTLITSNFSCTNCKLQDAPLNANNQDLLYIRWVVTTTKATNSSNSAVGAFGSSLLKNVIVKGNRIDEGTEIPTSVVAKTPAASATEQTENALVSVKFNKGISLNSGYNPTIVENNASALTGITATVNNDTLIIDHPNFLKGKTYTVNVPKGLVSGTDGVALANDITWSFTIKNATSPSEPKVIAEWVFTNGGSNGSFPATNGLNKTSSTFTNVGGVFEAYDSGTKAISYQGWNGSGAKYWLATVPTTGYENITLSSVQNSSGTGPRDFKVQTSTDNQTWQDVPNTSLKMVTSSFDCAGDTCKLSNVPVPNADNKSLLYIRWLVSSNVNTKGEAGAIGSYGSSRIKDIRVSGSPSSGTNPDVPTIDEVLLPSSGAVNVAVSAPVTVKFNKPISLVAGYTATIKSNDNITLSNVTTEVINNNTLKINHPNFTSGKSYTVSLPRELIKGQDNLPLIRDVSWSFTVQSSTSAPVLPKLINMTFNGDPKTSIALAWYTDVITNTVVQVVEASAVQGGVFPETEAATYQGSSEKISTFVIPGDRANQRKTNYYSHKAIANNLTPGKAYKYRVGNGTSNSWSQIGSFTTDAAGNQSYHFIAGSDSQASSRSGFEPWADTFEKAIGKIGNPKFLLSAGDLVDHGDLEEQWQWMLGLAQNELTTVPFVPVLGGHEVQDYDGDETTPNNNFYNHFNLPKQVVAGTHEGSVYSFEYGDALYLVFNSQFEGKLASNGTVQSADREYLDQVKWMKNTVAKSDKKWKFVAFHKGPYAAGDNSGEWEDDRVQFYKKHLVPAFDEMGIDMVFEAHDHMYMRSFQMYNDLVVPTSQIKLDSEGNAINPKGTVYLMSNSLGNKFYTKYPGYNDYFAAKNLQPNKKMFTDVSVADQVLQFTAYTAAIADEGSGNNGVKVYDHYGIRRTDVKPAVVTNASVVLNGNKAVISWRPPTGSTEPVRGYRIYEKNDKVSTHWSEYIPAETGKTQYSFTVNNINASTNYEFIIKAVGARFNSDPVQVNTIGGPVPTNPPAVPTNLTGQAQVGNGPSKAFPQHTTYTGNTIKPNHVTQTQMDATVTRLYDEWKEKYLKQNPYTSNQYYVWYSDGDWIEPDDISITVSEAHGYGMLITAIMAGHDTNAKTYFDGMYRYFRAHPSEINPDLMAWQQGDNGSAIIDINGVDSATDGDMDIAYALLLADSQWGSSGAINYLAEARKVIDAIMESDVNQSESILRIADWATSGTWANVTRPSDFMLQHMKDFRIASNDSRWDQVINKTYDIVNSLYTNYSPNAGLLSDFVIKSGRNFIPAAPQLLESDNDGDYYYNSARTPWRIGTDYLMTGDMRGNNQLSAMNSWIRAKTNNNPSNIMAGYKLDGSVAISNYGDTTFSAPFMVSAMINSSNQAWLNSLWDHNAAISTSGDVYYGNTIRLLSMLVVSGNWWAPTIVKP